MSREADVVIVGGGLHGCSAALQLALRGKRVIVLERRYIARHSSGINAGGVRTMGRHVSEIALSLQGMEMWHRIAELVGDDCGFVACGQVKVAESASSTSPMIDGGSPDSGASASSRRSGPVWPQTFT